MIPKRIRHRTEDPDNPCRSMPCPECGCCPDCNVCLCGLDYADDEAFDNYVDRVREGETRACVADLHSLARSHEKLAAEERTKPSIEGMARCHDRFAKNFRDNADWLWKRRRP